MKNNLVSPCNACPFRKTSAPGWLGPWTADDLVTSVLDREIHFPCHKTMTRGDDETDVPEHEQSFCRGALLFMKKSCKMPRDKTLYAAYKEIQLDDENLKHIMTRAEFLKHHDIAGEENY